MFKINFDHAQKAHFIGIGGISMSGLAEILLDRNFTVSGSDRAPSDLTRHLESMGAKIFYPQAAENVDPSCDFFVYTAAIHPDNPEFIAAKATGKPMLTRAELLGQIMDHFKNSIAVSGTHGKTTTTSMISQVLLEAFTDPTISVGGIFQPIHSNVRVGQSDVFITEGLECTVVSFGLSNQFDYYAKDITFNELGYPAFTPVAFGQELDPVQLHVPGKHNVVNALSAIALLRAMGISYEHIVSGLAKFSGADRRFQYKGKLENGTVIIDDYAHHPTEIAASLNAALHYPHKRIIVCFQPHTYTRTKAFLQDFIKSLSIADVIVLADIYAAREQDIYGVSSQDIKDGLDAMGKECYYFHTFDEIQDWVEKNSMNGDLLITMGAGNIVNVGENLLK